MKNTISFISTFCLLSLSSAQIFSDQQQEQPAQPISVTSSDGSKVYIAPAWEYVNSQFGDGTKQSGSLWGASVGYTYSEKSSLYLNLEFTGMAGRWTGSAGKNPTQEYITELQLGYVASICDNFTLTPFTGAGSYVFNQTLPDSPNFHSYFWFIPIGVSLDYRINESWAIGLKGTGAPTFSGSWKVHKRENAPTTALWQVELPVTYYGSLPFECSLIPFVKQWAYLNHGSLIKQRNTYYGLQFAFGYKF